MLLFGLTDPARTKSALHEPLEKQTGEQCSHPPLQQELIGLQVLWQPWQSSNMTFRQLPPLLPILAGTLWAEQVCLPAG